MVNQAYVNIISFNICKKKLEHDMSALCNSQHKYMLNTDKLFISH